MTDSIWFLNTLVRVLLDADVTDGVYDLLEMTSPSGHGPPPHVHESYGEGWTVLEGELTVHTPAASTIIGPGQAGFSPAGEAHSLKVSSTEPLRMLVCSVPARFVDFVRAFGEPAERDALPAPRQPDVERLTRVAAEHGITMLAELPPASVAELARVARPLDGTR
jgi:mannose-6-phosphate isomerase-like protein (cupin superfamily)